MSEYDPLRPRHPLSGPSDLDRVQELFSRAASGYVSSPWPWVCWAFVLPTAALMTPEVAAAAGPVAVLLLWSVAIILAGAVETLSMRRARKNGPSDITRWVFRSQGNLSLIAIVLTVALAWQGMYEFLPAVWLLLIGHSFFAIGGLAASALKRGGLLYQIGGVISLLPWIESLIVFAVTTAVANAAIALSLLFERRLESR